MFKKIMIANRGEIAVRIIRACKEMGIATVAVYSEADKEALHVSLADESICLGGAYAKDSYLNMQAIVSAAAALHAEAIHPGYGFLSENASFAALCKENNIVFIGPSAEIITKMGDKDNARKTMQNSGVPIIPGTDILPDIDSAYQKATQIGFPLLIKARSGGGGKGIRLVEKEEEFRQAFTSASSEAKNAFGDEAVYLEKFLFPAKHIEMQIICDQLGNVVCLGERECSIQRNKQKLIEESPSPAVNAEMRDQLIEISKKAAHSVKYDSVGTIEFLMDQNENFYFMEMNTRLQVEHPVTEMMTGIDLVKWQIRVSAGMGLTFQQNDIQIVGSAIECRINAENPAKDFRPSCGEITFLHVPGGPWVRFDTALYQSYQIPPYYDSLIAKLIVYAKTREEAIRKMNAALCELVIEGIDHNRDMHTEILKDQRFINGNYYTDFIDNREQLC